MIAVVDYGLGNVSAFTNIYRRLGLSVAAATTPSELLAADHVVLPGVGSFDWAMRRLVQSGMRDALEECAFGKSIPILGVCVGMQIMARSSDEGNLEGLGWIEGEVRKIDTTGSAQAVKLPHMGWNNISIKSPCPLFDGLHGAAIFYFLHSYHFVPERRELALAEADYCGGFVAAIGAMNIFGVQFHPEKSHESGIRLLENFSRL